MENFFKCPKCGDLSYENFIPNIGRHLLCPYCKTKFSFEPKHLIGKGTKLGLVKRYSEVELNQLFLTTFKNTEAPVAEEPQEETSPEPQKAEVVEVAVSELPKEDATSIVETANEPAKEATSPEPQEAEAVEVAVAELPKGDTAFILETAKEPAQETTSSKPEDADVVNVSVTELPKEEPTSTTETASEPVHEETSPEPPKAQAVDVAVAELPKEVITCAVENIKGLTYKEKSKIDFLPKIAEIKPHSIYPTCKPAVKTIERNLRTITENEITPKRKESLKSKISDSEILPLDIVPALLEIKPTTK